MEIKSPISARLTTTTKFLIQAAKLQKIEADPNKILTCKTALHAKTETVEHNGLSFARYSGHNGDKATAAACTKHHCEKHPLYSKTTVLTGGKHARTEGLVQHLGRKRRRFCGH